MKFLRNIPPTVVLVAAELLKLGNSAREDAQLVTGPIRIGMQRKTFSQTPRVFERKRKLRRWELDFAIHLECVYQLSEAVVDQCPADWMLEQGNFGTLRVADLSTRFCFPYGLAFLSTRPSYLRTRPRARPSLARAAAPARLARAVAPCA